MKKAGKSLLFVMMIVLLAAMYAVPNYSLTQQPEAIISTNSIGDLNATLLSFDNNDISRLSVGTKYLHGDANGDNTVTTQDSFSLRSCLAGLSNLSDSQKLYADIDCDTQLSLRDMLLLRMALASIDISNASVRAENTSVSWNSTYKSARLDIYDNSFSVRAELSGFDFTNGAPAYAVIRCSVPAGTTLTSITVTPVFDGRDSGCTDYSQTAAFSQNGTIVALTAKPSCTLTAIIVTFNSASNAGALYIPEIFLCKNEYSAQWICENRIAPSAEPTPQTLSVSLQPETTAIRLLNQTADDRTNTNGGMYHDFKNSKWPSVAVDENDKLYVVASGARMAHIDPFGATIMATSTNGGATWSKPSSISNTILDDRDAGIVYLGNGKLLVSYFTMSASSYLPGGDSYFSVRYGGAPSWAGVWNSSGYPTGGIMGTHVDILEYVMANDPTYNVSAGSYLITGTQYGTQWSTQPYSFTGSGYTSDMQTMLNNLGLDRPGVEVPVTSCHGPVLLSDSSLLYVGKVMKPIDQSYDTMAAYASYDDGVTWTYLSRIPTPVGYEHNNFHELSVTETADGALFCAMRAQPTNNIPLEPELTVYTCFSYDGGRSWTTPQPTGMTGAPPHVVTMDNGDLVMVYGYRTNPRCIYASISTDGGRTWSNKQTVSGDFLNNDDMGYPCSAVLSDGTICTVYYGTFHVGSENEQYSSILCSRWTYSFN